VSIRDVGLRVEFAVGVGVGGAGATMPANVLEIETSTAGGTSAIDEGRIETAFGGIGGFVIDDPVLGLIETGGVIPDELVPEADWVDATCDLTRLVVELPRRASRLASFDNGSASISLSDVDRRWDPLRASADVNTGEFAVAGRTLLRRGVRTRVVARHDNEDVPLFTGFVDEWPTTATFHALATREVRCHDWFGVLAGRDRLAVAPVGAGETVTARLHRLLDQAAVPAEERDIGTSTVTLQATTLAQNLLTELKMTAACDGGDLWVTPSGVITFRSRSEMMQDGRRWAAQHIATNDYAEPGKPPPGTVIDLLVATPPQLTQRDGTFSRIELARPGGTAQAVEDAALIDEIGVRSFARSDLLVETDAQVMELAQATMLLQPTAIVGVRQVVHDLSVRDQTRREALRRTVGDRIGLRWTDPVLVNTVRLEGVVAGGRHEIEMPASWQATFVLDDQTDIAPFAIEDSAIEGPHFISW
jgi:hypothetical protein